MTSVTHLFRYPIKAHGREALEKVSLITGQSMPWDRHWAVAHEATKFDPNAPEWVMCRNFTIACRKTVARLSPRRSDNFLMR